MPTENPKISAYVPQSIYDRFKQFQEERGLSMSQATTELIAEYFGINLKEEIANQFTGELPSRLLRVEQELTELRQLCLDLSSKIDLQTTSKLYSELPNSVVTNEITNHIAGELRLNNYSIAEIVENNELPISTHLEFIDNSLANLTDQLNSRLNSELPIQLELVEDFKALISEPKELLSEPDSGLLESELKLSSEELARRLKTSAKYIVNQKAGLTSEEFTEWTAKKDPSAIGWQPIKEGRKVYYLPVSSSTSEPKGEPLELNGEETVD